jgi:hypothetical protein
LAYQLDFFALVKAFFVPVEFPFHLVFLAAVGIPLGFLVYRLKQGVPFRHLRGAIAWVLMAPVGVLLVLLGHIGVGWQLEQEQLHIKTVIGSGSIELDSAEKVAKRSLKM